MRKSLPLAALLGLAALGAAQVPTNEFHVYDGSVEFTSRGALTDNEGELLQGVSGAHFGYLRPAVGMYATVQDQDQSTPETVHIIFRKDDGTGKPDISPTGLIYMEGPYIISGTGTGVGVFPQRWTFLKPVPLPDGPFFYGLHFSAVAAPNTWPNDGGSVHMSGGYPTRNVCGERPRLGIVPDLAWDVNYTAGKPSGVTVTTLDRSYNMGLLFETPLLQPYAIDPASPCLPKVGLRDFGYAGLWPDLADLEKTGYFAKFGWRVRDASAPNGLAVLMVCPIRYATPFLVPGVGSWYLYPFAVAGFGVTLDGQGQGFSPDLDLNHFVRAALLGTEVYAQAVVFGRTIAMTNWAGISF